MAYIVEHDALRDLGIRPWLPAQPVRSGNQRQQQLNRRWKRMIAGRIWVVGTPAEEIPPPASKMLAEALDGTDVILMFHGSGTTNRLGQAGLE